jgi:hypothetical protein
MESMATTRAVLLRSVASSVAWPDGTNTEGFPLRDGTEVVVTELDTPGASAGDEMMFWARVALPDQPEVFAVVHTGLLRPVGESPPEWSTRRDEQGEV